MNAPRTVRLGSYAVIQDSQGALLMARMSPATREAGSWTLPGGSVDFAEHPDAALVREVKEETGLTVEHSTLMSCYSRANGEFQHIGLLYQATVAPAPLRDETNGSTDLCRWIDPAEFEHVPLVHLASFAIALLGNRRGPNVVR